MRFKLVFILSCFVILSSCKEHATEVIICSSIHGLHKTNTNYSYENLFNYINDFNPDIIGIEIRQEDIDSTSTYLKKYYPFEMYQILEQNGSKIIFGVDWLGTDIEGKPIPNNYFSELDVIQLSNKANADSVFQKSLSLLNEVAEMKDEIASNSSIVKLNNGKYDSLNASYYEMLGSLYRDTPYSIISEFYTNRDTKITERIIEIIDKNRGKRLIFIVGADHRSRAVESFKKRFKNDPYVNLLNIK
jgi:hypothetical protein